MKQEVYFEESKRLIEDLRKNGISEVKVEVLTRKVDREGLIIPEKVRITYQEFRLETCNWSLFFASYSQKLQGMLQKEDKKKGAIIMLLIKVLLLVMVWTALTLVEKEAEEEDAHYLA